MSADDMREAFKKAGIQPPPAPNQQPPPGRDSRGRPGGRGHERDRGGSPPPRLPNDYLCNGYFDEYGNLHANLLMETAEQVADAIGTGRDKIKSHQLRRFFNHAKSAEDRLRMLKDFDSVKADILQLSGFARDAQGKGKIPRPFLDFIEKNLENIKDEKSFTKGFIMHFEAVLGNFSYKFPKQ